MRSPHGGDALLIKSLRDFDAAWLASGERWRDATRQALASELLEPWQARAREAARCVHDLELLLREAIAQCR
jgi:hypothetical protein